MGRPTQWLSMLQPMATGAQKEFPLSLLSLAAPGHGTELTKAAKRRVARGLGLEMPWVGVGEANPAYWLRTGKGWD